VVLDADLAEATKTGMFKKAYPDRFFDTGIAEANMVSVAAGIASTGKTVFASSFAMFAAGRAFEQIRNSVAYPHLNVKIGATHAGITVGEDGATHQCLEDLALMRSIPGMVVINPADSVEARAAVEFAINYKGPVYLRFCRLASEDIFDAETFKFELGKAQEIKEGNDVTIISTGLMATASLEAAEMLKAEGINARVINMASIKPIDEDIIVKAAKETGAIVTVEDHSVIGGLGTAVADVIAEKAPATLRKIGVKDMFGRSGKPAELLKVYGMTAEDIKNAAKDAIANK
jgi:transketolase